MTRSTTRCSPTTRQTACAAQYISSILKDHSGRIWISSIDGGLSELVLSTGQFTTYNEKNGLMNNQNLQNRRRER